MKKITNLEFLSIDGRKYIGDKIREIIEQFKDSISK
jgi:hypothetical protein